MPGLIGPAGLSSPLLSLTLPKVFGFWSTFSQKNHFFTLKNDYSFIMANPSDIVVIYMLILL